MKIYNIASICLLGLATLCIASCNDDDEEVTTLNFSKNFAPLDADAKSTKETSATITWKASANATGYSLEVFADDSLKFEGTPVQTLASTEAQITITDLMFDTRYSVRIKAITDGNENRTSSWTSVTFKTTAKQFLKNPKENDIADRSVTLTWDEEVGFAPTSVTVGTVSRDITDEERTAKSATITGLSPETSYTAYLYYNGKECGKRTFSTIADLEGATVLHDTDNLTNALKEATDGQVFALYGGKYYLNATMDDDGETVSSTSAVKLTTSIIIKGIYPTSRPVIYGRFQLDAALSVNISQAVLDGSMNSSTDQLFTIKSGGEYPSIEVKDAEIRGYNKGIIYCADNPGANGFATVNAMKFDNCLIHDITCANGLFDFRKGGYIKDFTLTNSTIYNSCENNEFIRMDYQATNFPEATGLQVTVDHCTIYNIIPNNQDKRLFYLRFQDNKVTFTNNIVANCKPKRGFTDQSATDQEPTLDNNFYFKTENLTKPGASAAATIKWFDTNSSEYDITTDAGTTVRGKGNGKEADPGFANAEKGDFTLNPDSEPAKAGAGDPRWIK